MRRRIFGLSLSALVLCGCVTVHNNRLPFSAFAGKEVVLLRSCILEEYIAANPIMGGELYTYWEKGKPTELVFDDRFFSKPVKKVQRSYGIEYSLYNAADYRNRVYCLRLANVINPIERENYGGPYREYELPIGTKVFITKAYTFNGIDVIYQKADGKVTIPGTSKIIKFVYTFETTSSKPGSTYNDIIGRAPWEDESTPEKRFVGWDGKQYKPEDQVR